MSVDILPGVPVCAWCSWRSEEGVSNPLELEFQMVVSYHVGPGS